MKTSTPRLRADLEIIPTAFQGEKALLVRDFIGLIQKPVLLQRDALWVFALIDGKKTSRDIQLELIRQKGGEFLSLSHVEGILAEFEVAFLLDDERTLSQMAKLVAEYSSLPARLPSHAGLSYPADKKRLEAFLDSILESEPPFSGANDGRRPCAIIAPHIDLNTGRQAYARAYGAVRDLRPKRVILLGTGHSLGDGCFSLTDKDFETPLGLTKTDKGLVRKLRSAGQQAVSPSDLAHRKEHSLEFELLFLQHLFGLDFTLIPVLCGSFDPYLSNYSRASGIPGAGGLLASLAEMIGEAPQAHLVVAGVDFSHIGPKFGHRQRAAALLLEAREHDGKLLDACLKGDAEAFWKETRKVRDGYNVCGFSTLACLLEILPGIRGELLDYEFWMEEATDSAVSYAAAAFYRSSGGGQ